jgi:hypothetical protein
MSRPIPATRGCQACDPFKGGAPKKGHPDQRRGRGSFANGSEVPGNNRMEMGDVLENHLSNFNGLAQNPIGAPKQTSDSLKPAISSRKRAAPQIAGFT